MQNGKNINMCADALLLNQCQIALFLKIRIRQYIQTILFYVHRHPFRRKAPQGRSFSSSRFIRRREQAAVKIKPEIYKSPQAGGKRTGQKADNEKLYFVLRVIPASLLYSKTGKNQSKVGKYFCENPVSNLDTGPYLLYMSFSRRRLLALDDCNHGKHGTD